MMQPTDFGNRHDRIPLYQPVQSYALHKTIQWKPSATGSANLVEITWGSCRSRRRQTCRLGQPVHASDGAPGDPHPVEAVRLDV
jgi:hypothetical protein